MATTTPQTQTVTATATTNATECKRGASDLVLAFFTSPLFMMAALGLALLAQGKHTADVFAFWSHKGTPEWLFYAFAGGVEIAVFIFVLHDHKRTSYAFAVGAFATNVVYYAIGGANLLSAEVLPVLLLSVLLPGVIVGYSHTIAEKPATNAATSVAKPANANARRWWQRLAFWRKPAETLTAQPTSNTTTPAPIAPPSESGGHSEGAAQTSTPEQARDGSKSKVSPETKAIILRSISNGAKVADVATEFDVSPNTVRSWIARTAKQTNGVH
jgi:hypothetical protein